MMERMRPRGCQAEADGTRRKQKEEKPKKKIDSMRAMMNWENIIWRITSFVLPMLTKLHLFRNAISRNEEWYVNTEQENSEEQNIQKMGRVLGMRRSARKESKEKTRVNFDDFVRRLPAYHPNQSTTIGTIAQV